MPPRKSPPRKSAPLSQRGPSRSASTWIQARKGRRNVSGPFIRKFRELRDLTQTDILGRLARQEVVMTQVTVAKIEAGQRAIFDYELAAFAKALKVDVKDLLP